MRRSPADDADGKFALELFVVLGVGCVLVWAAGQLAGLLFAQTWLRLGLVDLPWILYGWIRNWQDPALAWPADVRSLLPGPVGMYLCLTLVVMGLLAAFHRCGCAGCDLALGTRPEPRSGRHAGRSAAWQCAMPWAGCRICGKLSRAGG